MAKEVIFVQSKIRPGAALSPCTFKAWYEDVHIPDLLQTPGIGTVLRYLAADTPDDEAGTPGFPHLAVYPRVDREWVHSETCEFLKVPLHNDMLPGPKGFVFDVADFVMGVYEETGASENGMFDGPPRHLVIVPVEQGVAESQTPDQVLRESLADADAPVRSVLLRYDFSPTGKPPRSAEIAEGKLFVGRSYVAFHQLNRVPEKISAPGAVVYNLTNSFGDINTKV